MKQVKRTCLEKPLHLNLETLKLFKRLNIVLSRPFSAPNPWWEGNATWDLASQYFFPHTWQELLTLHLNLWLLTWGRAIFVHGAKILLFRRNISFRHRRLKLKQIEYLVYTPVRTKASWLSQREWDCCHWIFGLLGKKKKSVTKHQLLDSQCLEDHPLS